MTVLSSSTKYLVQFLGWLTLLYVMGDWSSGQIFSAGLAAFAVAFALALLGIFFSTISERPTFHLRSLAAATVVWLAQSIPLFMSLVGLYVLLNSGGLFLISQLPFELSDASPLSVLPALLFFYLVIYSDSLTWLYFASLTAIRPCESELVRAARRPFSSGPQIFIFTVDSGLPWFHRPMSFSWNRWRSKKIVLVLPAEILSKFSEHELTAYLRWLGVQNETTGVLEPWRKLGLLLITTISLMVFISLAGGHIPFDLRFVTWLAWLALTLVSLISLIRWTKRRRDDLMLALVSTWSSSERNHLALAWFRLAQVAPLDRWRYIELQTLLANGARNARLPLTLSPEAARIPTPVLTILTVGLLSLIASWP